jgi:hypothetical protein
MSIRPVDFNGMLQRADDVGVIKHQQDSKPLVDQQNIQSEFAKTQEAMLRQVAGTKAQERMENHADAKDEGNGLYYSSDKRKKKEKKEEPDKVKEKTKSGGFDVKI